MDRLKEPLGDIVNGTATKGPTCVEPNGTPVKEQTAETTFQEHPEDAPQSRTSSDIIRGKIQKLGDFIDTDAPEFSSRASAGYNVVIAGRVFGCGSSREGAVSALVGFGIQYIITKSFTFIYAHNAPNLGLLGIVIEDEEFYELQGMGKRYGWI
ncbi:aconitase [Hyaloscypha variabilis F]|uniref:Aconitase n=1 Tax=Hyaloscypha variabilis (strain UAMH 11265 / GT02V1 / F) TaxID=1149755 RepID=A0A2J6QZP0_HYAVF|nr:aconitase [Hyaloscypha variabilis F]